MSNGSPPLQQGEYLPLPECDATTIGLGQVWNRHSMRAYADANIENCNEAKKRWMQIADQRAIEVAGLRIELEKAHRAAQASPPEPAATAIKLAEIVLSDCGFSRDYTPLLERVAGRITRYSDDLLAVQSRLHAAPPAPTEQWMPIETAPRDGTPILLKGTNGRICDGMWSIADNKSGGMWVWAYISKKPIEWMPIPPDTAAKGADV